MSFSSPPGQQASHGITTALNQEEKIDQVATGKYTPESSEPGTFDNTPAGVDSNDDSGFFENDESYTHQPDYEDWILFPGDYPAVDTSEFFADADAVTQKNGSFHEDSISQGTHTGTLVSFNQHNAQQTPPFYDPIHEAAKDAMDQDIYAAVQAMKDCLIDSQPARTDSALTPLQMWTGTFERHESLAYRIEQPPCPERFFSQ